MKLNVRFFFKEVASAVECSTNLTDKVLGLGRTFQEAEENYYENFNKWSKDASEAEKKRLNKDGLIFKVKEYTLKQDI